MNEKIVNYHDVEELAYRAMDMSEDEVVDAINDGDIDQALYEKYEISFDRYCDIVNDLIKFTPIQESPLTGSKYQAFVDLERSMAIVKLEVAGKD